MPKISELLTMSIQSFNKLDEKQLRKVVQQLNRAANSRIKTLHKAGISTPATRAVESSGGKFTSKGKSLNKLRSEYIRVKQFLENPTSTKRGYNDVKNRTINTLKERGVDVQSSDLDELFTIYEKLKERNPEISARQLKYSTLSDISNALNDNVNVDDILIQMQAELQEIYERQQEEFGADENDISRFFEI